VSGIILLALALGATNMAGNNAAVHFDAGALRITLSATGHIVSLYDLRGKRELLPPGKQPPLLYMTAGGKNLMPTAVATRPAGTEIVFGDPAITARVRIKVKPTHATLELRSVTGCVPDHVYWGPYTTTIGKTVGEIVGVVRDDNFAAGLQALNLQTLGGANKTDAGGDLYAYAVENDGGVKGSAIALFGCAARDALATIGKIEEAEGLPHPMLDGVWAKVSPKATLSYMIVPYGERDIYEYCTLAKRAGLQFIYHPGPFETWGHFKLNPAGFPRGDDSMKTCVQQGSTFGIGLGVHTLTAFITNNDPYVTPVPDPRLGRLGSSTLSAAIDDIAAKIPVADREPFVKGQNWGWNRKFVIMGQEIAEYESVTDKAPFRLLGCKRGMFGTKASAHDAGADIGRLATHNYQTFYPGIDNGMADEMADRLIELFNNTGLRMMSFDGMEGLWDYGHGLWAANRFIKRCYDGWKQYAISDASGLLHFLWHDHLRMNWGEPWGKAVREGMPELRFANQDLFDRNLFPHMMGWFELRAASSFEATTLDDMEWVLSKCAGFNAGFAVVSDLGQLKANALTPTILDSVREWEAARHAGAFSAAQRERLKSPAGEWHLEAAGKGRWRLRPLTFSKTMTSAAGASADWAVENKFNAQPLRFTLRVLPGGAAIKSPAFEIGGQRVSFAAEIKPGQYLVCEGAGKASLCDANWHEVLSVAADGAVEVAAGAQTVRFTCEAAAPAQITARFKTLGEPEMVSGR
jgi:hypothetical protein